MNPILQAQFVKDKMLKIVVYYIFQNELIYNKLMEISCLKLLILSLVNIQRTVFHILN